MVTNVRARFGLSFTGTATREGTSGTVSIGLGNQDQRIATATEGAVARLLIAPGQTVEWDLANHADETVVSWTAGTAQVETATAAGTATASGNITVTVTSTGMSGSPRDVVVAIASGDTASQWATKVRTALSANSVIAARFTVGGSGTSIVLTRKPLATFEAEGEDVNFYPANDTSLNIGIADTGTTGITPASTSTGTTSGVATAGYKVYGEGVDFEGRVLNGMSEIESLDVRSNSGAVEVTDGSGFGVVMSMRTGGRACFYNVNADAISFAATTDPVDVEFCFAGIPS